MPYPLPPAALEEASTLLPNFMWSFQDQALPLLVGRSQDQTLPLTISLCKETHNFFVTFMSHDVILCTAYAPTLGEALKQLQKTTLQGCGQYLAFSCGIGFPVGASVLTPLVNQGLDSSQVTYLAVTPAAESYEISLVYCTQPQSKPEAVTVLGTMTLSPTEPLKTALKASAQTLLKTYTERLLAAMSL